MYPSHPPFLYENDYNTINPIINSLQYEDDEAALFLQNLHDFLHDQQQQLPLSTNIDSVPETASTNKGLAEDEKCIEKISEAEVAKSVKRRSCKKDRHSKINTAHGPRDRRMRLSIDVACRFFGLQDLLGFNKPSNTVEWLLENSKSAIKQLKISRITTTTITTSDQTTNFNCGSSGQYCEVLSGIDESPLATLIRSTSSTTSTIGITKDKMKKKSSRRGFRGGCRKITSTLIKRKRESREKARERARERTREKNIHKRILNDEEFKLLGSKCTQGIMDVDVHNLSKLGFFETGEDEEEEEEEDIFGDSLLITSNNWSTHSTSFIYHHHQQQQQQHNPAISHQQQEQQHQLSTDEFPVYGKPWEDC